MHLMGLGLVDIFDVKGQPILTLFAAREPKAQPWGKIGGLGLHPQHGINVPYRQDIERAG
jgi:hypothetical protein